MHDFSGTSSIAYRAAPKLNDLAVVARWLRDGERSDTAPYWQRKAADWFDRKEWWTGRAGSDDEANSGPASFLAASPIVTSQSSPVITTFSAPPVLSITDDGIAKSGEVLDYANENGTAEISDGGGTLTISDNGWHYVEIDKTITAATVLTFEYFGDFQAEWHGIGFDTDTVYDGNHLFQLEGTQTFADQSYDGLYSGGWQTYTIAVGQHFTGTFANLVLAVDDDAGVGGQASFRNISFHEDLPPPPPEFSIVDDGIVRTGEVLDYANENGTAEISDGGGTLTISDNGWHYVEIDKTITAATVLTFEYFGDFQAEWHGIGFDTDTVYDGNHLFQLEGTQTFADQSYDGLYSGGWQTYTIAVGQHFTGTFANLVLAVDDDAGVGGQASFRNISFHEDLPPPPPEFSIVDDGIVRTGEVLDYANENGTAEISDGGGTLTISDNGWHYVEIDKTITAATVLTFEYFGDFQAEWHGIGFDTDTVYDGNHLFQLEGTQTFADQSYDGLYSGGWQTYTIAVGQHFTGTFANLVLAVDDDAGVGGQASFRNISFHEDLPPPPPEFSIVDDGIVRTGEVLDYANENGTAEISDGGGTLTISDNGWHYVEIDKTITAATVLTFEYFGDFQAEWHGIGFDTDTVYDGNHLFQLEGTQTFADQSYDGLYSGGWQTYTIAVGQHFTGTFANLVLAVDDDAGVGGQASFRNISFHEQELPETLTPADTLYAQQWHLQAMGELEEVWADYTGAGVKVGIYDDGVQRTHHDLNDNYETGLHTIWNGRSAGCRHRLRDPWHGGGRDHRCREERPGHRWRRLRRDDCRRGHHRRAGIGKRRGSCRVRKRHDADDQLRRGQPQLGVVARFPPG